MPTAHWRIREMRLDGRTLAGSSPVGRTTTFSVEVLSDRELFAIIQGEPFAPIDETTAD